MSALKDKPTPVPRLIGLVEAFRAVDPEMPAHTILAFLMVAESMPDGILQNDLQQRMGMSQAAVSRNVMFLSPTRGVNLPGHGLVDVEIVPENRRLRRIKLSPKGTKLLDRLVKTIA